MKLITIVIPVFNEEKHITDCIHSVLAFKVPDQIQYEIWVIDGGSTDKTRNIIKSIQINNDSVVIYLKDPGSPVLIKDLLDKNSFHVVMPMKI